MKNTFLTILFLFLSTSALAEDPIIIPIGGIQYPAIDGVLNLTCADNYSTFQVYNLDNYKQLQMTENKNDNPLISLMTVPLMLSDIRKSESEITFNAVYAILGRTDQYSMVLKQNVNSTILTLRTESGKEFQIPCVSTQ